MALTPDSNFGPYRIIEPIGRGGMASVYKGYEAGLDRYVALKVLPPEFLHDQSFADRFRREAKVIAKLEHPNIVPIHAFGIDEGLPWMAMRLVPGGTVHSLSRGGLLERGRVIEILRGVADALDYAHENGVVHRDIKPQNILLDTARRAYLADFGVARMLEGSAFVTKDGAVTGTPQYMSPEQAQAQPVDRFCDIYALGIVAYEMFTGRVPFTGDNPVGILMKHVMEPVPVPSVDLVPEPITRAILKCVAKKKEDRWPTASAFVAALEKASQNIDTMSVKPPRFSVPAAPMPPLGVEDTQPQRRDDSPTRVVAPPTGAQLAVPRTAPASPAPDAPRSSRPAVWLGLLLAIVAVVLVARQQRWPLPPAVQAALLMATPSPEPPTPSPPPPTAAPTTEPIPEPAPSEATATKATATPVHAKKPALAKVAPPPPAAFGPPPAPPAKAKLGDKWLNPRDSLEYLWIPAVSKLKMGCVPGDADCYPDEKPYHNVKLTRGFWLGRTEVTVGAYRRFADATKRAIPPAPGWNEGWASATHPIVGVAWADAQAYCTWLGGRLPTEAEWEHAARGGKEALKYPWGSVDPECKPGQKVPHGARFDDRAGCTEATTEPVASYGPNPYALFDMAGNVWEWCADWYGEQYYAASPSTDPRGPEAGTERVLRGGSLNSRARGLRISLRNHLMPATRSVFIGMRCAVDSPRN